MNVTVFSSPLRERESKIYLGQILKRKVYISLKRNNAIISPLHIIFLQNVFYYKNL